MYDFSQITERVYCGAAINTLNDILDIRQAGITHIADARIEYNDGSLLVEAHWPLDDYLYDPALDDGLPKPVGWFQNVLDFALPALSKPGVIVLTHCAAGVNRGPSLAYCIMRAQGWTKDDAYALIKSKRPIANIGYRADADSALIKLGW